MEKSRDYGIDLLRMVLMIFIVIGHLFAHTDIRRQVIFMSDKWMIAWALQAITVCAVDCFVLITGYYMSSEAYSLWKGGKLWLKVIIYSVGIYLIMNLTGYCSQNVGGALDAFFPILRNEYWFITMYLLLYLFIPFINDLIENLSRTKMNGLIAVIFIVFYIEPLFSVVFYQYDDTEGFSIIAFITLYLIGAYLRKYKHIEAKQGVLLLLGNSSIILISKIVLQTITERNNLCLGTGLLYHNNSVFVLMNAIALFYIFKGIHITCIKIQSVISWCTSSVFGVYLLHENPFVRKLLWCPELLSYLKRCGTGWYIVTVLGLPSVIFVVSLLIDKLVVNRILEIVYKLSITKKIKQKCDGYSTMMRTK